MPRRRRVRWRKFLLLSIALYVLVMTFGGCADRLILWSSRNPIDPQGAQREMLSVDGKSVEIWRARSKVADPAEPSAFVLEFCGNATRAEEIACYVADRWARFNVEAWVMNYPGYGGSEGPAKLSLIPKSS